MKTCSRFYLSVLVSFLSCFEGRAQVVAGPVQGPGGNYYEIVFFPSSVDAVKWTKAEALAESRTSVAGAASAHLATITTPEEDVFIEKLRHQVLAAAGLDPHASNAPPFWVGGFQPDGQSSPSSNWQWVNRDGEIDGVARYTNWRPGEPNDWPSTGVENNEENHLVIGLGGRFIWADMTGNRQGYVVEYEMDPVSEPVNEGWGPSGNLYRVVLPGYSMTWEEAARDAWQYNSFVGGRLPHLATIDSVEEGKFIEALRQGVSASWENGLWLGGYQRDNQSTAAHGWRWVNDEGVVGGTVGGSGYSNWNTGEPNDWPSAEENGGEDYLGLRASSSTWNDIASAQIGYVMEYEADPLRKRVFRSTRYSGESHFRANHEDAFSSSVELTVEAWVHREDVSRTESILSHGSISDGFFFGFAGEKIRFGRSGGFAVLSIGSVPIGQWTHVAVSYDGSMARFYINGEGAGAIPLQNAGHDQVGELRIGGAGGGGVLSFKGSLDEVRLWSEARSATELNSHRFVELDGASNEEDLVLALSAGGRIDAVSGQGLPGWGRVGTYPELQYLGVLPKELVVPQASNSPKFDGNVDPQTEYAGAEEMLIRYEDGPSFRDARAYLVHDGEFLYVGIEGARLPAGGSPLSNNALTFYLDPDGSSSWFDSEVKRAQYFLQDGTNSFSSLETDPFERWIADEQLSVDFGALRGTERVSEFTSARDVELRFRRSITGDFHRDGFDRLAIVHANHGGPGGTSRAPEGALGNQPGTWAEMRYTPRETGALPSATLSGSVINPANGEAIEGITVRLLGFNGEYAVRETDSAGRYFFRENVGVGDPLRVVIDLPPGAVAETPVVLTPTNLPTSIGGAEVSYAGCTAGSCTYSRISFQVRMPLPATSLLWFTPGEVYPEAVTRQFPDGKTAGGLAFHVEIANIHDDLTFYLLMDHCPNDPTASPTCVEGVDYFRLEATRITPPDGSPSYFEVRIPGPTDGAPEVPFPRSYRLAAHDTWSRPANNPTQPGSWRYASERVAVVAPPYEDFHGLPFVNIGDGHDIDSYRAAFPDQTCNPLYMVGAWAYAPIYLSLTGNGECVGMVVTANRLARNRFNLRPGSPLNATHGDVKFGNGFRHTDGFLPDGSWVPFPFRPARYDVSNPCAPEPTNIWGLIKANHGVQFSSEFIGKMLEQFDLGEHGLVINHADVLEKIRFNPLRYQICVRDGGKGHCVQPLRVIDTVVEDGVVQPHRHNIEVWDPNWPNRTREIEVTIEPGQPGEYYYNAFSKGPWQGNWMFAYEIDPIWEGGRHIPSIDTLGAALSQFSVSGIGELLQLVVSGDAEAMVSLPGHSAGWDGSGNFSETGEATIVVPPFNWLRTEEPALGHLSANMIHRLEFGAPEVIVHNRGETYNFHSSHEGTMFQYFVSGAENGSSDEMVYQMDGELVTGLEFQAGGAGRTVDARVALCDNGESYPAAMTFESLAVPLGTSVGVSQLSNTRGVELRNDTGAPLSLLSKVTIPTSIEGGAEPEELDIPRTEVPAGGSIRMMRAGGSGFENLFVDIDGDRDGDPEFSFVFVGESGELIQTTPVFEPRLGVSRVGDAVRVTWKNLPGWSLAYSEDLVGWSEVAGVLVEDGMAIWSSVERAEGGFVRLQRETEF